MFVSKFPQSQIISTTDLSPSVVDLVTYWKSNGINIKEDMEIEGQIPGLPSVTATVLEVEDLGVPSGLMLSTSWNWMSLLGAASILGFVVWRVGRITKKSSR